MKHTLLALGLIGVAALGGCAGGVLDPTGPISFAERQILFNSTGIMLLIVILTVLATAWRSGSVASFWVANTTLLWAPGVPAGLAVLAVAQMGVHLVFFLHITTGPDSTNNVLALAFGLLIASLVLAGSLVIMANLDEHMAEGTQLMEMQKRP